MSFFPPFVAPFSHVSLSLLVLFLPSLFFLSSFPCLLLNWYGLYPMYCLFFVCFLLFIFSYLFSLFIHMHFIIVNAFLFMTECLCFFFVMFYTYNKNNNNNNNTNNNNIYYLLSISLSSIFLPRIPRCRPFPASLYRLPLTICLEHSSPFSTFPLSSLTLFSSFLFFLPFYAALSYSQIL